MQRTLYPPVKIPRKVSTGSIDIVSSVTVPLPSQSSTLTLKHSQLPRWKEPTASLWAKRHSADRSAPGLVLTGQNHTGVLAEDPTQRIWQSPPHQQPFAPASLHALRQGWDYSGVWPGAGGAHLPLSTPAFCSPPRVIQVTGRWLSRGKTKHSKIPSQHIEKQLAFKRRPHLKRNTEKEKHKRGQFVLVLVFCFECQVMSSHFLQQPQRHRKKEANVRI